MASVMDLLVRVMGNGSQFRADMSENQREVSRMVDKMDGIHDKLASIKVEDQEGKDKIKAFEQALRDIRDRTAKVDVTTQAGRDELLQLKSKLAELRDKSLDIKVNDADAILAINNVKADLNSLSDKTVNVKGDKQQAPMFEEGNGLGLLGSSIMSVLPTISPLLAVATGGAMALSSAFSAAGAGVTGFGAVAIPTISTIAESTSNLKKAQAQYNAATNDKQRTAALQAEQKALAGLNSEQRNAVQSLVSFENFWNSFAASFQRPILGTFTTGLQVLRTILTDMKPAIAGTAQAVQGLMNDLKQSLGTPPVQEFFAYLGQTAGPMVTAFGKIAGNMILGVMNLMTAFAPLAQQMVGGLLRMSQGFAQWSANVSQSQGFQNFIRYVQQNGPVLISIIGNVVRAVGNIVVALAPMGAAILRVIQSLTSWLASFTRAHQGIVQLAAGIMVSIGAFGLLRAGLMSIVTPITSAFTGVSHLIDAFREGGTINVFASRLATVGRSALSMASNVLSATGRVIASFARMVASAVATAAKTVASWVMIGAQATANAVRVAAAWTLSTGAAMARAVASMAVTAAQFVARWTMMGAQALIQAARMAAAWFIALGPIGWVTAAVIAIAALIIANWSKVSAWTKSAWSAVSSFLVSCWHGISSAASSVFNAVRSFLSSCWNGISSTVRSVWNGIKGFLSGLWNGIRGTASSVFNAVRSAISSVWNGIRSVTSSVWNGIRSVVVGVWNGIRSRASSAFNGIRSVITAVWNAIRSVTSGVWNGIRSVISGAWSRVRSVISSGASAIRSVMSSAWNAVRSGVSSAWSGITGVVRSGVSRVGSILRSIGSSAFSWGRNLINMFGNGIKSAIGSVANAAKSAVNSVKKFLGFHSPAEEGPGADADVWAPNLMKMFIGGVNEYTPALQSALNNAIAAPKLAVSTNVAQMISGSNSGYGNSQSVSDSSAASSNGDFVVQGPLVHVEHMDASNPQDIQMLQQKLYNAEASVRRAKGVKGV